MMKTCVFLLSGFALVAGCKSGPVHQCSMPYSIVKIEMTVMDEKAHAKQQYNGFEFLKRMSAAGPAAAPELAFAFESQDKGHRSMAGYALEAMLHWGWPEAWDLLMKRLGRLPPAEEAGHLLAAVAVAHRGYAQGPDVRRPVSVEMWARHRGGLLLFAATYLGDEYVVETVTINHPDNKVEMRICDYAAYVVQAMSDAEFGSAPHVRSDTVVEKARLWVRENMEQKEDGKTVLKVPEALARDRMK